MKTAFTMTIPAALGFITLMAAPPSQADDQSFLDSMDNVYHGILSPGQLLNLGHGACSDLRAGKDPMDGIPEWGRPAFEMNFDTQGLRNAAQHELCPDTL
jgi:hypothetical protein